MFRACDIAGVMGLGREVERGPGRHGPPNGVFVYFRDPDGHRLEFILPPLQMIDLDEQPSGWDSSAGRVLVPWGPPPPERWARESTPFTGIDSGDPRRSGALAFQCLMVSGDPAERLNRFRANRSDPVRQMQR